MGLAGEVVLSERDKIRNIKHISCINIRISHEIKGGGRYCAAFPLSGRKIPEYPYYFPSRLRKDHASEGYHKAGF